VNKNVNEEDLKCQQKAEHKYDSLFSDTVRLVRLAMNGAICNTLADA
jgi:hypothetical protein